MNDKYCIYCGKPNPGNRFCTGCGKRIFLSEQKPAETEKNICICGAEIMPGLLFCIRCGKKITKAAPEAPTINTETTKLTDSGKNETPLLENMSIKSSETVVEQHPSPEPTVKPQNNETSDINTEEPTPENLEIKPLTEKPAPDETLADNEVDTVIKNDNDNSGSSMQEIKDITCEIPIAGNNIGEENKETKIPEEAEANLDKKVLPSLPAKAFPINKKLLILSSVLFITIILIIVAAINGWIANPFEKKPVPYDPEATVYAADTGDWRSDPDLKKEQDAISRRQKELISWLEKGNAEKSVQYFYPDNQDSWKKRMEDVPEGITALAKVLSTSQMTFLGKEGEPVDNPRGRSATFIVEYENNGFFVTWIKYNGVWYIYDL